MSKIIMSCIVLFFVLILVASFFAKDHSVTTSAHAAGPTTLDGGPVWELQSAGGWDAYRVYRFKGDSLHTCVIVTSTSTHSSPQIECWLNP